jgi:hypothetical protein
MVETCCQIKDIKSTSCADGIYLSYTLTPSYVPAYEKYKQQLTTDATKYGQPQIQRHCSFAAICGGVIKGDGKSKYCTIENFRSKTFMGAK